MSFDAPLFLLALALVPLGLLAYALRERRAGAGSFVDPALLVAVAPRRPGWRRHVPVVVLALAIAALIVGLARPQTTVAVPVEQATVVVVTDRSGSMLAKDVAPNRLLAARRAAQAFVDSTPDDLRIGAIAFNQSPTVLQSPTREHAIVREALGSVEAAGSTATGDALQAALSLIRQTREQAGSRTPAAVVLLSDGESVRGRDVLTVASTARQARVPVYTVALGTQEGTITSKTGKVQSVPPDVETLRQVAQRTRGQAFAISDAERLEQVYEELGSQLATEEQDKEMTSVAAGTAFVLLLLAGGASARWFGRPA